MDSSQSSVDAGVFSAESQGSSQSTIIMPPRRKPKATASPRSPRPGTPVRDHASISKTPVPAKYSTSYGSSMTQLPDRSTISAGINITKAAAEIFSKVKQDNIAAEERRRKRDQERAAKAGTPLVQVSQPPADAPKLPPPSTAGGRPTSADSENTDSQSSQSTQRRSPRKRSRDKDAEELARKEQQERDRKLKEQKRREEERREAERKAAERKEAEWKEAERLEAERKETERIEAKIQEEERKAAERLEAEWKAAAKLEAELQRLEQERFEQEQQAKALAAQQEAAQQAAVAATAAMQPPPPRHMPPPSVTFTPLHLIQEPGVDDVRPGSVRSFVEEQIVYNDAQVQTPVPVQPRESRLTPAPPRPSVPAPVQAPRVPPPPPQPQQPISPPSVLSKPPKRLGGTPVSKVAPPPSPNSENLYNESDTASPPPRPVTRPDTTSPSENRTTSTFTSNLRNRTKPVSRKFDGLFGGATTRPTNRDVSPPFSFDGKLPFSLWSIIKVLVIAFLFLSALRFFHERAPYIETPESLSRLTELPSKIKWSRPLPSFFTSDTDSSGIPQKQYENLKSRTQVVEDTVNRIKAALPDMVSVTRDKNGNVILPDALWEAIRIRILADHDIYTLDSKGHISDPHWKGVAHRLRQQGLPVTAAEAEKMWEKWMRDNKRKVAEIIRQGQGKVLVGTGETVMTKEELIAQLRDELSSHKADIDAELEAVRKDMKNIAAEVKKVATQAGLSKSDIISIVQKTVNWEISRRIVDVGRKAGTSSAVDAAFSHRVNYFSPGNNALIDVSLTSPTYVIEPPRIGSKDWWKSAQTIPGYLSDARLALTPWTDPGQCWCAGILASKNQTVPATLGVTLPGFVIPQHVVVEHIDPGATNDPGSMPRDIELWGYYPEASRHGRVKEVVSRRFPATEADTASRAAAQRKNLESQGFLPIARFTYEHKAKDDGVFVYNLTPELNEHGIGATETIVVRALNNYGARDHTCFYRVRLYGETVDVDVDRDHAWFGFGSWVGSWFGRDSS